MLLSIAIAKKFIGQKCYQPQLQYCGSKDRHILCNHQHRTTNLHNKISFLLAIISGSTVWSADVHVSDSLLMQGWKIGLWQTGDHSAVVTSFKTSFTWALNLSRLLLILSITSTGMAVLSISSWTVLLSLHSLSVEMSTECMMVSVLWFEILGMILKLSKSWSWSESLNCCWVKNGRGDDNVRLRYNGPSPWVTSPQLLESSTNSSSARTRKRINNCVIGHVDCTSNGIESTNS